MPATPAPKLAATGRAEPVRHDPGADVSSARPVVVRACLDPVTLAPFRHAARIVLTADPHHDDPERRRTGVRRRRDPAGVHPVFADGTLRDAVLDAARSVVGAAAGDVVAEWVEGADPGDGRPGSGEPGDDGPGDRHVRCWFALGGVDAPDAPQPPGVALEPGDLVVHPPGCASSLPDPPSAVRTAYVVVLATVDAGSLPA